MATLLLSAAGAAIGGAAGGSFVGLTSLALGKAAGATLGSVLDQRLMGLGAEPVETGRVDRFRIMGSSEGAPLPRVFGRMRVAGQIIWSSRFMESANERSVGGKGGGPSVREFSYSISLAIALCEGEILRVGRIWADGQPVEQSNLNWRLHAGTEDQLPDPVIAATEGADMAPAYRGTAYVVFEQLDLSPYGNRIPQFNFEVFRRPVAAHPNVPRSPALDVRGVALVPGTGEYALATEPVFLNRGKGDVVALNINNDQGIPDFQASLGHLREELPNARSVALVVSWFGDDLRCDRCMLRPGVEQSVQDGEPMKWKVSGQTRENAKVVSSWESRPIFGGTPADASVLQAIAQLRAVGQSVMFYPFILMDIVEGNSLTDPWTGAERQPPVPWRGRITLSIGPGQAGSPDKTSSAADEVARFFGQARASDFQIAGTTVLYTGPEEWSYRRFILHHAHLCVAAGGVDAFCIGSELRSLTQIRDAAQSFPAVRALAALAEDVRAVLGDQAKIGYAADWSEYFGYQPDDGSGDVLFHLDPLWSHSEIDFVGIDNYMPLSDWRDGSAHADAAAGSIYDLSYLTANVAGGEGYEWYYPSASAREKQDRRAIVDGAYGEHWVFRYKDLLGWWSNSHQNRLGGEKVAGTTPWKPQSKPIWFTELGCPAVNKGTNQPNVFHDPKSSESFFPYYSSGARDDFIQYRYLQATFAHWNDPANNPLSEVYGGQMVDMSRAHVWAWDARPWPDFPNRLETWVDGSNYEFGHWMNGRASLAALEEVVSEICGRGGLPQIDVSSLHGALTGYMIGAAETARQSLQPLLLAYGFDSFTKDGSVAFANRNGRVVLEVLPSDVAVNGPDKAIALARAPAEESAARLTLGYVRADFDYQSGAAEAVSPDRAEPNTAQTSLPLVLFESEARAISERWLSEARVARDTIVFSLPPSRLAVCAGDIVTVKAGSHADLYRIDRVEEGGSRLVEAVRIEPGIYEVPVFRGDIKRPPELLAPTPVYAELLDLPLLTGKEAPHAPHIAVAKRPWRGTVAVLGASEDYDYAPAGQAFRSAVLGETLDLLPAAVPGLWMRSFVRVRISHGTLQSRSETDVLNGANVAALRYGDVGEWEVIQFQLAELIAPGVYRLNGLLRGQAGTDGVMPPVWPAGTEFVLLDAAITQLDVPASVRGLQRHYRIGLMSRPHTDPSYVHKIWKFDGVGLRPYKPVHFRARRLAGGSIELRWMRRTRINGDSWVGIEVPLGEEREGYHLRVRRGATVLREFSPVSSFQTYTKEDQTSDGAIAPLVFEVAQVSDHFGPGPFERIEFDG